MSLPPIALISSRKKVSYDDSGSEVIKSSGLPPSCPLYHPDKVPDFCRPRETFNKVPPLGYFGINKYLESISLTDRGAFLDAWPTPIPYRDKNQQDEPDLLQMLIPHLHRPSRAAKWSYVDPKLWLTVIRIYWADTLPETFRKYPLPLADPYLPYTQQIDPTPDFTLLVVLNLRRKKELTDETIIALKVLHQLAVLEIAGTEVSNAGIAKLAEALRVDEGDGAPRGPWRLRCLGLSSTLVDTMVEPSVRAFPLLSVVDLRDTRCEDRPVIHGWQQHDILDSDLNTDLFEPAPAESRMGYLASLARKHERTLFPSPQPPFTVHVHSLYHPPPVRNRVPGTTGIPEENGYFILSETGKSSSGNTDQVEKRRKELKRSKFVDHHRETPEIDRLQWHGRDIEIHLDATPGSDAELLQDLRILAYQEHFASISRASADRARRTNAEEIERARDPKRLTTRERLNRTLVLVRVPPSYDIALEEAVKRKFEGQKRLAAIREATTASVGAGGEVARKRPGTSSPPPLAYFYIQRYLESISLTDKGAFLKSCPIPIPYRGKDHPGEYDLLPLLIPHMHLPSGATRWEYVDPKLWLTLARVYWADTLPETFRQYPMPLADPYLPYMQYVEPTDDFSLLVVLDLRGKKEVTDGSIVALKVLHQLALLELSGTVISNAGVAKLAEALRVDEEDGAPRGPWRLRCLGLARTSVDTAVEASLRAFPLLSVVDLRGYRCQVRPVMYGWQPDDILDSDRHTDLFGLGTPESRMKCLAELAQRHDRSLFPSSQPPYTIYINELYHPAPEPTIPTPAPVDDDGYDPENGSYSGAFRDTGYSGEGDMGSVTDTMASLSEDEEDEEGEDEDEGEEEEEEDEEEEDQEVDENEEALHNFRIITYLDHIKS
ncbi:hypothetical protein FRB90_005508, partial [Tulasnella sp. 427]